MAIDLKQAEDTAKQIQQSQNSGFTNPNNITQNDNIITTRMNANKDYYFWKGAKPYIYGTVLIVTLAFLITLVLVIKKKKNKLLNPQ